ncbi:MAG: dCTP deaminase [Candidatus Daviesbacteria bacterium]|nr:dCTP deaminase [Candidatus Daviesbacteria bacterium]
MLTDKQIKRLIKQRNISVEPFDEKNVKAGKLDIHLGQFILKPKSSTKVIDPQQLNFNPEYTKYDLMKDGYILKPGEFILGQTLELIGLDSNTGMFLDGSTTMARLGLTIHQSSMFVPPGQDPHILTLEILNSGIWKVRLSYKLRVGKVVVFRYSENNTTDAKVFNQYNGQKEVTGAIFRK